MTRVIPKIKREVFAYHYIKEGFNGTGAVKKLNPNMSQKVAEVTAHRLLGNTQVQEEVRRLMKVNITEEEVRRIHKRNMHQSKNYAASNTALDMHYKIKGEYAPEKKATVTLNINGKKEAEEKLQQLQKELETLKRMD